jgi:hypothetical protein
MLFSFNHKEHKEIHKGHKGFSAIVFFKRLFSLSPLLLFSFSPLLLFPQLSTGGLPASFSFPPIRDIPEIRLTAPDPDLLRTEDVENEKLGQPRRVGIAVEAGIDLIRGGKQSFLPDGTMIWQVTVSCRDALAMGLYFDDFRLTEGCRMFVYDESRQRVIGAYTLLNNRQNGLFSTELLPGDRLLVEIDADPGTRDFPDCKIGDVTYVYRDFPGFPGQRGVSDDCEVNINCPEGDNWQYQKHGVVRIYVRQGGGFFWCSGSLLNNTLQNNEPFLLTADHCAPNVTPDDLSQWVFYFNYEAPECENPAVNPVPNSLTGAEKLAGANTTGSDFMLLRLADTIPLNYEPYYNGWSLENLASPRGVTIHHPAGDIRKISTYTVPVKSSPWLSTPGTHWEVYWSETANGWGVTEGGSSGSPLFDNTGKIIGALTGGYAACEPEGNGPNTGPDQPDYYGKFSYSWDQNGSEPSQQLRPWLDPINSGVTSLAGKFTNLTAAFQASPTLLLIGGSVEYTNLSSGMPVFWQWTFEGGDPGSFTGPDPGEVKYPTAGLFDISLVVSNGFEYDTLLLKDYIQVVGRVYPNPTSGIVNIFLEGDLPASINVGVYDMLGQKLMEQHLADQSYQLISLDLSLFSSGIYTVRIEIKQRFLFARVLVKH